VKVSTWMWIVITFILIFASEALLQATFGHGNNHRNGNDESS
jgi:hypothetical protein